MGFGESQQSKLWQGFVTVNPEHNHAQDMLIHVPFRCICKNQAFLPRQFLCNRTFFQQFLSLALSKYRPRRCTNSCKSKHWNISASRHLQRRQRIADVIHMAVGMPNGSGISPQYLPWEKGRCTSLGRVSWILNVSKSVTETRILQDKGQ